MNMKSTEENNVCVGIYVATPPAWLPSFVLRFGPSLWILTEVHVRGVVEVVN